MNRVNLRPAGNDDLSLLRYWDQQPHIIQSDPDTDWEWEVELPRNPAWREQLIAEVAGRAIGFIQIIDPKLEDSHYWGDVDANLRAIDIWIGEVDYLAQGYGTEMMHLAIGKCFDDPMVTAILIDPLASNTRAHRFYQRLGFKFLEERYFEQDHCYVYQLLRSDYSYPDSNHN